MEEVDYYELLGVAKTASHDEIRRAYRKLALRHHPDKNPDREEEANATFKKISEAYDVLSDQHKRSIYDRYGHRGLRDGGGRAEPDFVFRDTSDIFREVFGFGPFSDMFSSSFGQPRSNGPHRRANGSGRGNGHPFFSSFFDDADFGGPMFGGMGGMGGFGAMGMGGFGGMGMGGFGDFGDFGGGGSFTQSFSSGMGGSFSQQSSTVIKNGKRVTTTRTTQNGVTSERVEEMDQHTGEVLSLMIDGESQPVGRLEGPGAH